MIQNEKRKIKIAQIGLGHDHAPMVLRSILKQDDIFEFRGLYIHENEIDVFSEKVSEFSYVKTITLEEILNNSEIEAVAIETEERFLTQYSLLAAKHGKHIHMDKPGGMKLSDFEKLIDVVKEKKIQFHTGYMYRYNPEVIRLKEQIKNGELGEVFAVEAQMSPVFPSTTEKRQWLSNFKGGMMFFLGCHLVDIIVSIMGIPECIVPFIKSTGIDGTTSEDFGMAVLEYKNAVSFAKCCAAEVAGGGRRQIVVCGTKKTVEIKPIEIYDENSSSQMCADVAYYQNKTWEPDEKIRSKGFDRYDGMMKHFADCIKLTIENEYTPDYELLVYKCVLKACGYDINYKED